MVAFLVPLAGTTVLFPLGFFGTTYSFNPYIMPDHLTNCAAASAPENLFIILNGTLFVLPMILDHIALSHTVFRCQATSLSYDRGCVRGQCRSIGTPHPPRTPQR